MRYDSVTDLFKERGPHLIEYLDNSGAFWPKVKDNSISNKDLAQNMLLTMVSGRFSSAVFQASVTLLGARILGHISNPG